MRWWNRQIRQMARYSISAFCIRHSRSSLCIGQRVGDISWIENATSTMNSFEPGGSGYHRKYPVPHGLRPNVIELMPIIDVSSQCHQPKTISYHVKTSPFQQPQIRHAVRSSSEYQAQISCWWWHDEWSQSNWGLGENLIWKQSAWRKWWLPKKPYY